MGDELKDRLTLLESDVIQLSRAIRTIAGTSSTGFEALAIRISEVESQLGRLSRLAAYIDLEKGAEPDASVAEKIAANYVRFMETLLGPDLPEGVSPSAAVPNASHAITHREVVAWNAHQEIVTEGTLFFIQSEENRTPVYVVLPDGKEVLEYFDHARLTE
jgi:hypothetical protein